MSLNTTDIFGAIYKKYADTAALNTLTNTTTSLDLATSSKGKDMPRIAVDIVSWVPTFLLSLQSKPMEDVRVSFAVFDKARTHVNTDAILDQIEAAYGVNGTALVFDDTTYSHTISVREAGPLVEWDGSVWHGIIDYLMMFKKL